MGNSLIIVGDAEFNVDVSSYEVTQNKYKDQKGIVAVFDIVDNGDKQKDIVSAWVDFSDKVMSSLKNNTTPGMWNDPTFKLQAEENLQNCIMDQFRLGNKEKDIAIDAMILFMLNKQTLPIEDIDTSTDIKVKTSSKLVAESPSKAGIAFDRIDTLKLIEAIPEEELLLMRSTKSVKVISKDLLIGFTTSKPIPITTKQYAGVTEDNLEKAVREMISLEVLKSRGKPLYISKEPRVIFDKKDNNKFIIRETLEVCTSNEKSKV